MPLSIGLVYGSTDGNTARVAEQIANTLRRLAEASVVFFDLASADLQAIEAFDCVLFGVPTWNHGQLQTDWEAVLDGFDHLNLTDVPCAIFGLGDQTGYPDTFVDAMVFVADKVRECGGRLLGRWPVAGYRFRSSWAVEDGMFLGLVLDEVNQADLTAARIRRWVDLLLTEMTIQEDT